ncbi:MAG TPA: SDR family oxidoreductase [Solirubrobacteraceae bacterium]|nr:SDR family oxidoreductase [Solirubrobacteraceae bacterium]
MTGGRGGIGQAICAALAEQGFRVAAADLVETGAEIAIDVTDTEAVAAAVAEVEERLGPVDVLVNNAGWDELRPFLETGEEFWRRIVEINYLGALRVTHRVLPGMVERGWGRVVMVSSDAARVGSSLETVYAGAKAGLVGFGKSLAREVARDGVTVNSVCPGPTETPLLTGMVGHDERGAKVIDAMTRAVPMRRLGTPQDIAAAVAFFASEQAAFVTGQTLSVSGGLTMA